MLEQTFPVSGIIM